MTDRWAWVGGVVLLLAVLSPLWWSPARHGSHDWGKETLDAFAAREAWMDHGELPVWNRYCGGGNLLLGNPETVVASPFFVAVLLAGPTIGLKLSILLHALIGFWGVGTLVRDGGGSRLAAALSGACFASTGYLAIHLAVGHLQWQTGYLLPWVLRPLLGRGGERARGRAVVACAALALMVIEGGVHLALIAGVGLVGLGVLRWLETRQAPWSVVAILGLAVLLAGVKIVPGLTLLAESPHRVESHRGYGPVLMVKALWVPAEGVNPQVEGVDRSEGGGYWEYGAYVGMLLFPLVLAGLILNPALRRRADLWGLLALGVVLSLDLPWYLSPWHALHQVPPFAMERRPSRFIVLTVLALVVLAGHGIDALRRHRAPLAFILAFGAIVDVGLYSRSLLSEVLSAPPLPPPAVGEFETRRGGSALTRALRGRGTIPCRQGLHLPQAAHAVGDAGYRGEAWVEGEGEARLESVTSRSFTVAYRVNRPSRIVLNQNRYRDWTVEGGTLASHEGLAAADVDTLQGRLQFRVSGRSPVLGLLLSILGALLLAGWSRWGPGPVSAQLESKQEPGATQLDDVSRT